LLSIGHIMSGHIKEPGAALQSRSTSVATINKDGQGFNFEEIQGSIASNRGECLRRITCLVADLEWGAQEAAIRL
jgi:hypothetical protein